MINLRIGHYIHQFITFFLFESFAVTCSYMVCFAILDIEAKMLWEVMPLLLVNIAVVTLVIMLVYYLHRRLTTERYADEIKHGLQKLIAGDFTTRISTASFDGKDERFETIAAHINQLAEELSSLESLRSDVIANVSHELKTPLSVMHSYAVLLSEGSLSEAEQKRYAREISRGSLQLNRLITNILKLNKLENQQIYPKQEVFDMGELVCECLLQFESDWETRQIELDVEIAADVKVRSDKELLGIVVTNLLSNAFKFTPPGGNVSIVLESDETAVHLEVKDSGCGMSAETGSRIFEKFYQGDSSHASKGNGLGLALVKRVIDIVQGEIHVESRLQEGSAFYVKIDKGEVS